MRDEEGCSRTGAGPMRGRTGQAGSGTDPPPLEEEPRLIEVTELCDRAEQTRSYLGDDSLVSGRLVQRRRLSEQARALRCSPRVRRCEKEVGL